MTLLKISADTRRMYFLNETWDSQNRCHKFCDKISPSKKKEQNGIRIPTTKGARLVKCNVGSDKTGEMQIPK